MVPDQVVIDLIRSTYFQIDCFQVSVPQLALVYLFDIFIQRSDTYAADSVGIFFSSFLISPVQMLVLNLGTHCADLINMCWLMMFDS